jgi:hypothetical protein
VVQVLEAKDSAQFAGSTAVSIGIDFKSSANIDKVRYMLLGWTGTVDAPTMPPVLDWNTAGTAPTMKTSWTILIDTSVTTTASWVRDTTENEDISATGGIKNIALMIYTDEAALGAGDTLECTGVQIENSAAASAFGHRDYDTELRRCQRYYSNTFDDGDDPQNAIGEHTGLQWWSGNALAGDDDALAMTYNFPTTMRTAPTTIKVFNPVNDTDNSFYEQKTPADVLQSALVETITEKRVNWTFEGGTYDSRVFRAHVEAEAEF